MNQITYIISTLTKTTLFPTFMLAFIAGFVTACSDPATNTPTASLNEAADKPALAAARTQPDTATIMNAMAEEFVRLALALGEYDADYVDAYHGPKAWRDDARAKSMSLELIAKRAHKLGQKIAQMPVEDGIDGRRQAFIVKQFGSLSARARIIGGNKLSFDDESRALYDAVAPTNDKAYYQQVLNELESMIPGEGALTERLRAFRQDFMIPPEKVDDVFKAAIKECRRRTLQFIELPANERFDLEYVTDKPWSGYNWFQGDAHSLIQVNVEFPILIDRAVDLACHEGYPGHHVYNSLLEKNLVKDKGWVEFSVFPLFSPTGLIAEGSANYGIDMAFPGNERIEFEQRVLFPMAGLDASRVAEFYNVEQLLQRLNYAGNDTARRYLDGKIDEATAAEELQRYALMIPEKSGQRVRFMDKYRSYVINYNLGRDIVADWIEAPGDDDQPVDNAARWKRFEKLLSEPVLPSQLLSE